MTALLALAGAALGLLAGIGLGLVLGRLVRDAGPVIYWMLNVVFLVLGLALDVVGLSMSMPFLALLGLGLIPGGATGLKYGYGRVLGPWAVAEKMDRALPTMGRRVTVTDRKGNDLTDPLDRKNRNEDRADPTQGLGRPEKRP